MSAKYDLRSEKRPKILLPQSGKNYDVKKSAYTLANGWAGSPALARATPPAYSKRQVFQTETLLVLSCVVSAHEGLPAQNRLAQNQNCIRLGLGRFSEVPYR